MDKGFIDVDQIDVAKSVPNMARLLIQSLTRLISNASRTRHQAIAYGPNNEKFQVLWKCDMTLSAVIVLQLIAESLMRLVAIQADDE